MTQRCGRREGPEWCSYPAEHEVTSSTTTTAPTGLRLCVPCALNLERRGLVTTAPLAVESRRQ